ncbi:MAG TPA: beta-ketoacyl synthase N-terminal-like domain-containing protein [Thermoanaerobaculia bacterium]|jgi:acyl transferase domain-containing protein
MTEPTETYPAQGIAVVGMSGRFPGARSLDELWRNLRDGVESITFFSEEELIASGVDPALLRDAAYVRAKGVAEGVEMFEPAFFGFTPREAELMDPQHRLLLECSWEALEDAGVDPGRFPGRAAVYVGSGTSSYLLANLLANPEEMRRAGTLQVLILNDRDFAATRLSYKLNLRGPSAVVQTACSTGLMAVHMACQSLLAGEADLAVAGAVSITAPLKNGYLYQEGSIASPDGHCRSFDAGAGGSVAGTGAGVVVLKRLADALEAGDPIHAVILGSAANNDGSAKVGFTAPSIEGQAEAIAEGLLMADVEPDSIAYVEGHGSATALGDPIEVAALRQAFAHAGHAGGRVALGSIKSNVGHLNAAAGIAGLIRAVLALEHATIPPTVGFERPNPQVDFGPFYVPAEAAPWPADLHPRRAAVSSFGLGGTNVHAVLEAAPESEPSGPSRPWQLLTVSARTPTALEAQAGRLADRLEAGDLNLADVAFTLQAGRKAFGHRRAVVCKDVEDAVAALRGGRGAAGVFEGGQRPVVFLFPGLGDHYVDLGRELYDSEPVFAAEVDRCAEILRLHLGLDIREILFSAGPRAAGSGERKTDLRAMLRRERSAGDRRLDRTEYAQPILFAIEYALARLLMAWGVQPQAMIGYSLGEYVAACLSGVLPLEDALALVARRAKLIQDLPGGAMLAVPLPEAEVRPLLGEGLAISATNGPHFTVVGGTEEAVADLEGRLKERGATCLRLTTTHAFHTPMMRPAVDELTKLAGTVATGAPKIPYISNVTGTWITAADLQDPGYWALHMVQPVRFAEGLSELLRDPDRVMVEVGPGSTLAALVRQHPDAGAGRVAVTTLRRASEEGADLALLLDALGRLWVAGVPFDPEGLYAGARRHRARLPTYPFERQRCWIDPPQGGTVPSQTPGARRDLADWFWIPAWKQTPLAAAPAIAEGPWLVFLDRGGLGERIAARLRREGRRVTTVAQGSAFQAEGDAVTIDPARRQDYDALLQHLGGELPTTVLHLWGITGAEPSFGDAQTAGLLSLTFLEQALTALGGGSGPVHLAMVADGLHDVADGDPVHPGKATVLGAVRVIHQESARLTCATIDVRSGEDRLVDQLLAEASLPAGSREDAVAFRGRRRWARTFERARLEESGASLLKPGAAYLITDGVHGGGAVLAELLVRSLGASVALVVPPEFPASERWDGWEGLPAVPPGQDVIGAAVKRLSGLTAEERRRLRLVRAEAGDLSEVRALGPLQGVFHTAGAFTGGLIQLKTPEALRAALDPTVLGAEAWLAALAAEPQPPAFVLLMSSTLAFTGGLGQLDVAAGGAFLDALARRRAMLSADVGPFTVAAHWDPYQWDGWLIATAAGGLAGMQPEELQKSLAAFGVPAAQSGEALRRLLAATLPQVVVAARDLPTLIAEADAVNAETLLAQMAPLHRGEKAQRPGLSTAYVEPRDEREAKLAALWEELFGIAPVGVEDSFLELGGHSLLAIQMVTQIRTLFDADLPVTALFEAPTIAELAKLIGRARGEESEEDLEALLALVEGLSPEEAERKLSEMGVAV